MTYADLNDDLSDLFGDDTASEPKSLPQDPSFARIREQNSGFVEQCPKCRGTGKFISYAGRVLGDCYVCKGKGNKQFKTSPEARANSRKSAATRKQTTRQAFLDANPGLYEYLQRKNLAGNNFAGSLIEAISTFGSLTDRQLTAVQNMQAKDKASEEQREVRKAAREEAAPQIDISRVATAIETAQQSGLQKINLRLAAYQFAPAKATSANPGAIYVTTKPKGGEKVYLGKIMNGKFMGSFACTSDQQDEIIKVASDPKAAAVAYGKEFGQCSCCGRVLSDPVSVANGIGPICADKFGF